MKCYDVDDIIKSASHSINPLQEDIAKGNNQIDRTLTEHTIIL